MRPALIAFLVAAACGGSSGSPSSATFQLNSSGVTPVTVDIASGGSVSFTNKDAAAHQIASSDCPELNSSSLANGDSFSAFIGGPKTCHFNDSLNASNAAFNGTVNVAAPAPGY